MKTYNMKETASRIRDLRKVHRYTQEQAAELLEIDRRSLSNIEIGAKGCSLDLFIRISNGFNVSLDFLLLGNRVENTVLKEELDMVIKQLSALKERL